MSEKILVKGIDVRYKRFNENDYISLTDIAKFKTEQPAKVIENWMRNRVTVEYLGLWETLNNHNFNLLGFEEVKKEAGLNAFLLSPTKWIEKTGAIGIFTKAGKYDGGSFAHKDIAFKFASWISVEFELYIIKEFQRLKENEKEALEWTAKREFAKINYKIHTDAIKENIVPNLLQRQISFIYANEADLLNVALFGKTASEWRMKNPSKKGNIRDYASVEELLVLANLESYNAVLIEEKREQSERIVLLNKTASKQLETLLNARLNSSKLLGPSKDKKND